MEESRKDRQRRASVRTLLQIRRDSVKISEELAHLTTQLSAATNNETLSNKQTLFLLCGKSEIDNDQIRTITPSLVSASINQPAVVSDLRLPVDSNIISGTNQEQLAQYCERS